MTDTTTTKGQDTIIVKERDQWNDKLEAVQFLTRIFSRFGTANSGSITSDIVLAKLDERQRNFITESTKQAFALKRQIPDKDVADRVFDTIMVESMMIALLNRNIDKNVLMNIVGGVRQEDEPELTMPKETLWNTITGKIKKQKEPPLE